MGFLSNDNNQEKEVSSGAVIGIVLVGLALVLVIAFLVFMVVKKVNNNEDDAPKTQYVVTEVQMDNL